MKHCYFCQEKIEEVDYKNTDLLHKFLSGQSKILSSKRTGVCSKHQRKLSRAVKKARILGLVAFTRK